MMSSYPCALTVFVIFVYQFVTGIVAIRCTNDDHDFFKCANNDCVSLTVICDGDSDCGDGSDEIICRSELLADNYLVVAERHGRVLYQVSVNSSDPWRQTDGQVVRLMTSSVDYAPYALTFDVGHRLIYWTDLIGGKIMKTSLYGRRKSSDPELGMLSANPVLVYSVPRSGSSSVKLSGIAVDVVSNKLYYCDEGSTPKIGEVSNIDHSEPRHRIVITESNMKPRSIVFHQDKRSASVDSRFIYWTDYGSHPSISRLNLRPGSTKEVVVWRDVQNPRGLAIDVAEQRLYWTDWRQGRIERCNLNGSNRQVLYSNPADRLFGITLSSHFIYVTDSSARSVRRFDRQTRQMSDMLPISTHLTDVIYFSSSEHQSVSIMSTSAPMRYNTRQRGTGSTRSRVTGLPEASHHYVNRSESTVADWLSVKVAVSTASRVRQQDQSLHLLSSTESHFISETDRIKYEQTNNQFVSSDQKSNAESQLAVSSLRVHDAFNNILLLVVLAVIVVTVLITATVVIAAVCFRLKRGEQVDGSTVKVHPVHHPVAERSSNVYHNIQFGNGLYRQSLDSGIPDSRRSTTAPVRPANNGSCPRPAIQRPLSNKLTTGEDSEGYMVPFLGLETNPSVTSDCYDTIQSDEDEYLQPNEHIYDII